MRIVKRRARLVVRGAHCILAAETSGRMKRSSSESSCHTCEGRRARPPIRSNSLYYTALYCTVLNYTVLYCTTLYCTVLHCYVLHCSILRGTESAPTHQ
eukprot:3806032-Pyramimonas_sp.AAC.1